MIRQVVWFKRIGEDENRAVGNDLAQFANRCANPGAVITGQRKVIRGLGAELLKGFFREPALQGSKARRSGSGLVLARNPSELLVGCRPDLGP